VKDNAGLVCQIARKALPRARGGLELADLISEDFIGLVVAIRKYDPSRGTKLSTLASWWICQAMYRAIDRQASLVYVPGCAKGRGIVPPSVLSLDFETSESGDILSELLAVPDDVEGTVLGRIAVEDALRSLPDDEARIVRALLAGSTQQQVAADEGVSLGEVRKWRRQAQDAVASQSGRRAG
jgi:RNA polymerase sigma factor (sigma-70 family)